MVVNKNALWSQFGYNTVILLSRNGLIAVYVIIIMACFNVINSLHIIIMLSIIMSTYVVYKERPKHIMAHPYNNIIKVTQ